MAQSFTFQLTKQNCSITQTDWTTKVKIAKLTGSPSTIYLASSLHDCLLQPTDKLKRAFEIFDLARTIIHELAHAVVALRYGYRDALYYMPGSNFAEEGFESEAFMFGGLISNAWHKSPDKAPFYRVDGIPSALTSLQILNDYPSARIVNEYLSSLGILSAVRGPVDAVYSGWNISAMFFYNLTQQDFWVNEYGTYGAACLRPMKLSGHRYHAGKGGIAICCEEPLDVAPPLPAGVTLNNDGLMVFDKKRTVFKWNPSRPIP